MVKNPPADAGDIRDVGLIPGLGISPGEGNTLQYSCLKNLMDREAIPQAEKQSHREAWQVTVHRGLKESDLTGVT